MGSLPRQIYVSPTGDDVSGQGTIRRPFATVQRAALMRRDRGWNITMLADQYVNVESGSYFDTHATLTAADSGSNGFSVVYRNLGNLGTARLIGGVLASGWTLHSGSIYKLEVSQPCWTLYENGERAINARLPAYVPDVDFPCSKAPYFDTAGVDQLGSPAYTQLQYYPADYDPSVWNIEDVRLSTWGTYTHQIDWFQDTAKPTSLNTVTNRFEVLDNGGFKFPQYGSTGTRWARYYVQGPLELLNGPGQFVIRNEAGHWMLYYWPRATPIASQEIIIPTRKSAVSITGTDASTRAHHIKFDGFSVECTNFESWYQNGSNGIATEYDYFNTQGPFRNGGFRLENVDHIDLTRNHIHNHGFAGIFMQGYCQFVTTKWNWIAHTGTDGISVNGPATGTGFLSRDNLFDDQLIHDIGQLDGGANGIRLSQSGYNVVRNHHFFNGPRRALWMHGDYAVAPVDNYCQGNWVHHCLAEDMCQDSGDVGAFTVSFLSSPPGGPSQIVQNTLEQLIINGVHAHPSMLDVAPPAGLFHDNHSSDQIGRNIKVTDAAIAERVNDSDEWAFVNVSWLPGFDEGQMDTANIGTTASFPY